MTSNEDDPERPAPEPTGVPVPVPVNETETPAAPEPVPEPVPVSAATPEPVPVPEPPAPAATAPRASVVERLFERRPRLQRALMAIVLACAAGGIAYAGHKFYPIQHWLFWRYASYWLLCGVFSVACLASGHQVVSRLVGHRLPFLEHVATSFAVGCFAFFLAMFAAGAAQLYNPVTFVVLPVVLIATGGLSFWRYAKRARAHLAAARRKTRPAHWLEVLAIAFGVLGLLGLYVLILTPDNVQFDSRWKHFALAEEFAAHGGIRRHDEGWTVATYPHLSSYLYGWAFLLPFGKLFDRVELAAHIEFFGFLWTLVGTSALVRRLVPRAPAHVVWAARFLYPGVMLYDSSLAGGADHIAAIFVPPLFLALLRVWDSMSPRYAMLVAWLLAGAVLVKYTSLIMLLPIVGGVVAGRSLWLVIVPLRGRSARSRLRPLYGALAALGFGLLITTPHWLKNWVFYGDPLYPSMHGKLALRPWTQDATDLFEWGYKDYQFWAPTRDLDGVIKTVKATFDFSFLPNDWTRFHGKKPVFGFLFTLLTPCLLLMKGTKRIWGVVVATQCSIALWYWTHHQDRYLQTIVPWMVAVTAATVVLVWRKGGLARWALALPVAMQVIWGGDVYFFQTHAMIKSPLKEVIDLMSAGHERDYTDRLRVYGEWADIGASMPPNGRALLHDNHTHLGIGRTTVSDWGGWQFGISYGRHASPRVTHELLKSYGVTHVVWADKVSKNWDSLGGDVRFFDFALNYTKNHKRFGRHVVAEMWKQTPPDPARPEMVAVFTCGRDVYEPGLYPLAALTAPVFGPRAKTFPQPVTRAGTEAENVALMAESMATVIDPKCHKGLPGKATGAGFVLAAKRKVIGKDVHNKASHDIYVRSATKDPAAGKRSTGKDKSAPDSASGDDDEDRNDEKK